ncbi:hypothetical protein FBY28_2791 [Arthrobacter sp. SLBN-53]|nr:hypothetical protein FBY28_2791 [Arthrobacter sp. SLBN-53]
MCETDEDHLGTAPQGVDQAAPTARRLSAVLVSSRPRRAPGLVRMPPPGATVIGDLVHYQRARPDHPGYDRELTGMAAPVRRARRDLLTDQISAHLPSDWSNRPWAN